MTSTQHLDKLAPRWLRQWFRRRADPAPAAGDARAQALARRVVELETDLAAMRQRRDRAIGRCTAPCSHAALLEDAQAALRKMRANHSDFYQRLHSALGDLAGPGDGPVRADENGDGR